MYIHNPKTEGSGIICCIPQDKKCPLNCLDCFFQNGRSYLEPLDKNLPNIPTQKDAKNRIVRMNDGNDSNIDRERVINIAKRFKDVFFNTAFTYDLVGFPAPVVLTINPGINTNTDFFRTKITKNLMFVRFRYNTGNTDILNRAIHWYTEKDVPIVITPMAYFKEKVPDKEKYIWKKRVTNSYWCIKDNIIEEMKREYSNNKLVYFCVGGGLCKNCGNCIREYYATKERMRKN